MNLKQLRARLEACRGLAVALSDLCATEDRAMTAEETSEFDTLMAEFDELKASIERAEKVEAQLAEATTYVEASAGRQAGGEAIDLDITGGRDRTDIDPMGGFETYGEFCQSVRSAGISGGAQLDERLRIDAAAASTYAGEGTGADGGFLVPPAFSDVIHQLTITADALLPLTDNIPVAGNGMTFPKDETTAWGSSGVQARWAAEAAVGTPDKPVVGLRNFRLHKLISIVPITDELLEDGNALDSYLSTKTAEAIRWKTNDALYNGDGVGKPLGIMNAPCLVTVAEEGSQANDSIVPENIAKMFSRMPSASLPNAIWMMNNDCLPELLTMTLGGHPIYMPVGGLPSSPAGTLLGKPIMLTGHCATIGDAGDVAFIDWKQYVTITKSSGIKTSTSIHLYFDADQTAFKATFRVDGSPWLDAAITPARGATQSPFVVLGERDT